MSKITGSLSRYMLLSDNDMKNLELSEGSDNKFKCPPEERQGYISRHFDNIDDVALWKFCNGFDTHSDASGYLGGD